MISMKKSNFLETGILFLMIFIFYTCTSDKGPAPDDCTSNPVAIDTVNTRQASCGKNDGTIQILASGGSGNYLYSIDGTTFQPDNTFLNLAAGNYDIMVKDNNSCSIIAMTTIKSKSGLFLDVQTTDAGCGESMGSISIDVTGGIQPVIFGLEGNNNANMSPITDLASGKYTIYAQDSNGCRVTQTVQVLNGTSYKNDIAPILTTNCTLSGCHDGKSGVPDWTIKMNVINNGSLIKQVTQNKTMPKGSTLSEADIQTIACWVDDGAKDN